VIPKKQGIFNMMEFIVAEITEDLFLMNSFQICQCDKCKTDVIIMALNKLPARYVITEKGRIFTEIETCKSQYKVDVLKAVIESIETVRARPSHAPQKMKSSVPDSIDDPGQVEAFLDELEDIINKKSTKNN